MGDTTAISWTSTTHPDGTVTPGSTWNPVLGCSHVSDGCKFCYAETLALRWGWSKAPWTAGNAAENVQLRPGRMREPFKWKTPRRVFVNSLSDLFHEQVPVEYIARVFAVMALCPQHTFQVLTKRPGRMAEVLTDRTFYRAVLDAADQEFRAWRPTLGDCPVSDPTRYGGLPNVWLGTTVEDRKAVPRIAELACVPARVRFLSCEPLLEDLGDLDLSSISWVIAGGESGAHLSKPEHAGRWMDHAWARGLKDACIAHGTAFFFKQSSGLRTEQGTALIDEDGTRWEWRQFPGELTAPTQVSSTE